MSNKMSLRQIAKELGVSHTLLSLWRQGKRNLAPELEARYYEVVTHGYNEEARLAHHEGTERISSSELKSVEPTRAHPLPRHNKGGRNPILPKQRAQPQFGYKVPQ